MYYYNYRPSFTEDYKPVEFPQQHDAHVIKYRMHCMFEWFVWDYYFGRIFRELKEIPVT